MPSTLMRAITVSKPGGVETLKLNEVSQPKPKGDEVLVRNHVAGINFVDVYQRNGLYPLPPQAILGREGSGVIVELGSDVKDFKVGDRVAYVAPHSYAEYTPVSQKHVLKLPDSISFEIGAAMMIQGMTAVYLVYDSYQVKKNDFVLVPAAAGGTGSLICQMANNEGAQVIGLVSTSDKVKIAQDNGAKFVINYKERDFVEEVMKITNGKGVQVAYDGVGDTIYKKCLACMAKRGTYITFGNASGKIATFDTFDLTPKCLSLMRPALFNYIESREEFLQLAEKVLDLVNKEKIKIKIYRVYDFEDIAQAHNDLESRLSIGKLLIKTT